MLYGNLLTVNEIMVYWGQTVAAGFQGVFGDDDADNQASGGDGNRGPVLDVNTNYQTQETTMAEIIELKKEGYNWLSMEEAAEVGDIVGYSYGGEDPALYIYFLVNHISGLLNDSEEMPGLCDFPEIVQRWYPRALDIVNKAENDSRPGT